MTADKRYSRIEQPADGKSQDFRSLDVALSCLDFLILNLDSFFRLRIIMFIIPDVLHVQLLG